MKRNSTTLFLETFGYPVPTITPVSWVNNAPDLSGHAEPTRTVLENSYNNHIANGGVIEVIPDPVEPINDEPVPDWDGLYQGLMMSSVYSYLVVVGQQISGVDGALDKTIDAIQYGIFKPDSVAALPAFQSAISLLLQVLTNNQITLSVEHLAEVRAVLDSNGFTEVSLGE